MAESRLESVDLPESLDEQEVVRLIADSIEPHARMAEVLVSRGVLSPADAASALGTLHGLPVVEPGVEEVDRDVVERMDPGAARLNGWLPLRREAGEVLVATTRPPDDQLLGQFQEVFPGEKARYAVTSEIALFDGIMRHLGHVLVDGAVHGLERRQRDLSATQTLSRSQAAIGAGLLALTALVAFTEPSFLYAALLTAASFGYTANILFRFLVSLNGARYERYEAVTRQDAGELDSSELPTYTLLIPVFREGRVIGQLIDHLGAIDYPPEKLDILLLLEEGDEETIAAARSARLTPPMRLVIVPEAQPRTKPKACNVGLMLARGDLVVIYDAEDHPDSDQLRKAAVLFRRAGPKLVCVQAELNYWNATENALTRMFALEYSYWFDYMLQGLAQSRMPIPLGGTSNHFRASTLRELGGWDPHNVTEDADLGIRAAALGYQVRTLRSTTFEEACSKYGAWVKQRSRWIKGYMQTTLVHLRHPVRLLRGAGPVQALGFALLVGGTPITFLVAPVLWLVFLVAVVLRLLGHPLPLPGWLTALTLVDLVLGNAMMIYLSMMGGFRRGRYNLVAWSLLNPLYWFLHSAAAYRALWQLVTKPHYWEKTEHGIAGRLSTGKAGA